jgi:hypothetical protein
MLRLNILMKTKKSRASSPYFHWLFKLVWRSTSLTLKVPGKDLSDAEKRLQGLVRRMEGGSEILEIRFMGYTI